MSPVDFPRPRSQDLEAGKLATANDIVVANSHAWPPCTVPAADQTISKGPQKFGERHLAAGGPRGRVSGCGRDRICRYGGCVFPETGACRLFCCWPDSGTCSSGARRTEAGAGWKTNGCRRKQKCKRFSSRIRLRQPDESTPWPEPFQVKYVHSALLLFTVPRRL